MTIHVGKTAVLARGVVALVLGAAALAAGARPAAAAPPAGPAHIVSVGDSYLSGEGGRWAGNTNDEPWRVDALGSGAYHDAGNRESTTRCHRSHAAPVHVGGGLTGVNLACSGARTASTTDADGHPKPGLDFATVAGVPGQARQLQDFASTHRVTTVAVSIGGNDFRFGDVVQTCIQDFLLSPSWFKDYCNDDSSVTRNFTSSAVASRTTAIAGAVGNVVTAMERAGYQASDYSVVVLNYPSPLSPASTYRYGQSGFGRQTVGGCGFWNRDADWADTGAMTTINRAVSDAVARVGRPNVRLVDVSRALSGHRLCERSAGLLEERALDSWRAPGAVDQTEWVTQVRTLSTVVGPYFVQESLHPNYWGQLALRSCLRQAVAGASGSCRPAGAGLTAAGEPRMTLS